MTEYVVGSEEQLSEGERLLVELEEREICVFKRDGEYYAYANWCPHQGGPGCEGLITGTTDETFDKETLESELSWIKENGIVKCAWHGWEFDIETGECLSNKTRLPSYPTKVEDSEIIVSFR